MEISQEVKEGETGVSQLERVMTETDVPPVQNEDEPQTPYQLGWRTILAVLTLSMANVCAALSNTVCWSIYYLSLTRKPTHFFHNTRQTLRSNSK